MQPRRQRHTAGYLGFRTAGRLTVARPFGTAQPPPARRPGGGACRAPVQMPSVHVAVIEHSHHVARRNQRYPPQRRFNTLLRCRSSYRPTADRPERLPLIPLSASSSMDWHSCRIPTMPPNDTRSRKKPIFQLFGKRTPMDTLHKWGFLGDNIPDQWSILPNQNPPVISSAVSRQRRLWTWVFGAQRCPT